MDIYDTHYDEILKLGDHTPGKHYGTVLLCPQCGSNNLHHYAMRSYDRPEDAEHILITTVQCTSDAALYSKSVPRLAPESECPSARRDAVSILFTCEHCTDQNHDEDNSNPHPTEQRFELVFVQHKGTTYLHWRTFNTNQYGQRLDVFGKPE